jgi:hypothetical protein
MALDIPAIFKGGAATIFSIADSVMVDAVLRLRPGSGTADVYDPTTDTRSTTSDLTFNVRGLPYQTEKQKLAVDSAYVSTFCIQVDQAIAAGLTEPPNDADFIVIDGESWNVTNVEFDPANALYIFNLRKT